MNRVFEGFLWKLLERFGVQGVQFVIQLVLARLLSPEHYGTLSLMIVFTNLANVFIQTGFNTALIQNKDVTEEDFSSVFWVSFTAAAVLYGVIFFLAPEIAAFYKIPEIIRPLRVLAVMLFPGTLNAVQLAKVSREMDFRKIFVSSFGATVMAGGIGVALAYLGWGLWALVVQNLLNAVFVSVIMMFTVRWKPQCVLNLGRIKVLFSYGWKMLASSLLESVYQDMRSLVIGKKYDSGTLGYYNRGRQFPQFIINAINGSVQSVLLPAMSAKQDDKLAVKAIMRKSLSVAAFVIFPMMAGLAVVAPSLIPLLLTEKWMPAVPYMQIYCISQAFYPVHSCNLQAIGAVGRSDILLKLEVIKKAIGVTFLILAIWLFDSPIAIAMTGVLTSAIGFFVNAYPNQQLIGYSLEEQLRDLMPAILLSCFMALAVFCVSFTGWGPGITMLVQVVLGALIYLAGSAVLKLDAFMYVLNITKPILGKFLR